MIVGIEARTVIAGHDAPGAPILGAGCDDGVFAVETLRSTRQDALTVLKGHTVAFVRKRPAFLDQLQRRHGLGWQL